MKPVTFPIRPNQSGAAVTDLHIALLFLLKRRTNLRRPGGGGGGMFPAKDQLALLLNLLREAGQNRYGQYTIQAVRLLQAGLTLPALNNPSGEVDEKTANLINGEIVKLDGFGERENYRVEGLVYNEQGNPSTNVRVVALDKNLRENVQLGTDQTNAVGFYEIAYGAAEFTNKGKSGADLFVQVSGTNPVVESPVVFNARPVEEIDLINGLGEQASIETEYERLSAAVTQVLVVQNISLTDLNTDAEFSFVARQTGYSQVRIQQLAEVQRQSDNSALRPVFYAALRNGLSADPLSLNNQSKDDLKAVLEKAAAAGIISPPEAGGLEKIQADIRTLAEQMAGQDPSDNIPGLRTLLQRAITGPNAGQLSSAFIQRYMRHEGNIKQFWEDLQLDGEFAQHAESIRFTLQSSILTGLHTPMMDHLAEVRRNGAISQLMDVARWGEKDWIKIANEKGIPPGTPGDKKSDKVRNYVGSVLKAVEASFPAAFYAQRLIDSQTDSSSRETMRAFFQESIWSTQEDQRFDFRTINVDAYLNDHPDMVPDNQKTRLADQLKQAVRLYRLGSTAEAAVALQKGSVKSSRDITRLGQEKFSKRFGPDLGGNEPAETVYARARQQESLALGIWAIHNTNLNNPQPRVIRKMNDARDVRTESSLRAMDTDSSSSTNWTALFGPPDACLHPHCQTVYGPAAYLTDLLAFLNTPNSTPTAGTPDSTPANAFEILMARRPDLQKLELTCDNTNTALPYIDLVNELLEQEILSPGTPIAWQTQNDTKELVAIPRNVNTEAYKALGQATHPWNFPFNLWRETVDACLDHLGHTRSELQEALFAGTTESRWEDPVIALEYLGISPTEAGLIFGTTPGTVWQRWGFPSERLSIDSRIPDPLSPEAWIQEGDWISVLTGRVDIMLQQSGLGFNDLQNALQCYYVNPGRSWQIQAGAGYAIDTCKPVEMQIPGMDDAGLDRLVRFVRLWRRLDWSMAELDKALKAFNATELNEALLVWLSQVQRLHRHTGLPVVELLAWWGEEMDTQAYTHYEGAGQEEIPGLYARVFRNPAVFHPPYPEFTENPQDLSGYIGNHLTAVAATLGVKEPDLSAIEAGGRLTLSNLSELFRKASLSHAMKIGLEEAHTWCRISPTNPFDTPTKALEFLDLRQQLIAAGLDTANLKWLLGLVSDSQEIQKQVKDKLATLEQVLKALPDEPQTEALPGESQPQQNKPPVTESRKAAIRQFVADSFSISAGAVRKLLDERLVTGINGSAEEFLCHYFFPELDSEGTPVEQPDTLSAEAIFFHFNRIGWGVQGFRLTPGETDYCMESIPDFVALFRPQIAANDIRRQVERWKPMLQFLQLRRAVPNWVAIREVISTTTYEDVLETRLNWNPADTEALATHFNFNWETVEDWTRGLRAMTLLRRLQISLREAKKLAAVDPDDNTAQVAWAMLKSRYDEEKWLTVTRSINDPLRERRRNALVQYLLATKGVEKNWRDANDIYMYLLIDVEMSACQLTSRLKQAISSVQLFVQRCLFGLEPIVQDLPDQPEWKQWKWMKNYRVWEANRKVFLYPENWIEPELRDDKSPFFRELENDLLQNEITDEHAESVFRRYLEKLDAVARLEIVAVYLQEKDNNDKPVNILHVFGRTRGIPHQYYYRRQMDGEYWTPWEPVDADIEGDHLIPAFWNGRLYLFWPVFMPRQEEKEVVMPGPNQTLNKGKTFHEVMLAWSEYRNGQWAAKRMSEVKKTAEWNGEESKFYNLDKPLDKLFFQATGGGNGSLFITLLKPKSSNGCRDVKSNNPVYYRQRSPNTSANPDGSVMVYPIPDDPCAEIASEDETFSFQLNLCGGDVTINNAKVGSINLIRLPGTSSFFQAARRERGGFIMQYPVLNRTEDVLLIEQNFSIVFSHQKGRFTEEIPLFYQDDQRSFLVKTNRPIQVLSSEENQVEPGGVADIVQQYFPAQEQILRSNAGLSRTPRIIEAPVFLFTPHYHAYTCAFMKKLAQNGLEGLLAKETQRLQASNVFDAYAPNPRAVVKPYPVEEIEQHFSGAYSLYNWELFFHAPILIADRLSKNQRFEEALRWFHFVFSPLSLEPGDASDTSRYWQFRRFSELARQGVSEVEVMLRALAENKNNQEVTEFRKSIKAWRNNPFKPHLVARWRNDAYMRFVVMRYIDNLIAWGDHLFQRDTLESINEATQLYVLAAEILGPRPRLIAPRVKPAAKTYEDLKGQLNEFSNALSEIEARLPAEEDVLPLNDEETPLPTTLYFSIPANDKLLGYWDTVADRLFKIRTCRNLSGQVRQLPLFEPPIDPALLVRATAAGIDIASVAQDLSAGQPIHRFAVLNAKANELIGEVRALGNTLLSAFEKRDAEEMALLRSKHERSLLRAMREIRVRQVEEAIERIGELKKSKETIGINLSYLNTLEYPNTWEKVSLLTGKGIQALYTTISVIEGIAKVGKTVGDFKLGSPTTAGITLSTGDAASKSSNVIAALVRGLEVFSNISAFVGDLERRKEEKDYKITSAEKELEQLDHQILAAQIRLAIAEHELRNHDLQIEQAEEQNEFMQTKFSNRQLYDWMVGKVSGMYVQGYQLALRIARQAEKAMRYEAGQPLEGKNDFIQSGQWDSLKKGLLAGDLLYQDMKRMETAYLELNTRELELTKHISLQQLNPLALLELRENGKCHFAIPEELFDLDFPGHYYRRIKSVSITIPCVAGPYTTINATLRMNNNELRRKPNLTDALEPVPMPNGTNKIAVSSAQNDAGLFELNFRDERYLPFEGAGAVSAWELELMQEKSLRQFDYNTIADVIVHLRYTAREDNNRDEDGNLKTAAINRLTGLTNALGEVPLQRLFSLRYDFPNEWHAWTSKGQDLVVKLEKRHFPYFAQSGSLNIQSIRAYPKTSGSVVMQNRVEAMNINKPLGATGWEWKPGATLAKDREDWFIIVQYDI